MRSASASELLHELLGREHDPADDAECSDTEAAEDSVGQDREVFKHPLIIREQEDREADCEDREGDPAENVQKALERMHNHLRVGRDTLFRRYQGMSICQSILLTYLQYSSIKLAGSFNDIARRTLDE